VYATEIDGDKIAEYFRALQENGILGFTVKPRISKIRTKTLYEHVDEFADKSVMMPDDKGTLERGLRNLIKRGLLEGIEDKLRYVSVTLKGEKTLIVKDG
jgi:hypothetical protein